MNVESVWDYPRPPAVEPVADRVRVLLAGEIVAATSAAFRVVETSHPPTYYIPPEDVAAGVLRHAERVTFCEFKGVAHYRDVVVGNTVVPAGAWLYPQPTPRYEQITGYVAFYPGLMDECWVGDDLVEAQPGSFYGGWITPRIRGPFKSR